LVVRREEHADAGRHNRDVVLPPPRHLFVLSAFRLDNLGAAAFGIRGWELGWRRLG
jgi:hypothetical protein